MALIPCPECSRPISNRAHACPQCGFPQASQLQATQQTTHNSVNSLYESLYNIIQSCIMVPESRFNMKILSDKLGTVLEEHEETSDSSIALFLYILEEQDYKEIQKFYNSPESIIKRLQEANREELSMYYDRYGMNF